MSIYKEDQELVAACERLLAENAQAEKWLQDNQTQVGAAEFGASQAEIRRAERLLRGCRRAAGRKMCVGVFGPSQTGKSYLISTLAKNAEGKLWAVLGSQYRNFIEEINPKGERESTGLVTRFCVDQPPAFPAGKPVKVKLLSEIDLVKILSNAYYADVEHPEEPDREAIFSALRKLDSKRGALPQCRLVPADIEDLQEYVAGNFGSKPRVQALRHSYWEAAAALAPLLDLNGRAELFGILWNGLPEFVELYKTLAGASEALNCPEEAWCPEEALVPREKSIIDVNTLHGLFSPGDSLEVEADNGRKASLPRAALAALVAELVIYMRDTPADFFNHTDLLDFPGYRSREKVADIAAEVKAPSTLVELFLRGKVAYLFERYCAEKELTSLLLCIGPSTQEVKDLPIVINKWVAQTHGNSPEGRSGKPCSLFFVFTKCDMAFERKAGAPDVKDRWDTRLETGLLKQFGRTVERNWPEQWDNNGVFKNIFLLRNPKVRFDAIMEMEGEQEKGIRAEAAPFVEEVKRAFFEGPLCRAHFAGRHEETWDALMSLNDGGISHIRNALAPLCNPELKRIQVRAALQDILEKLRASISRYWRPDDAEGRRKEKQELSMKLAARLLGMIKTGKFGLFLRQLELRDQEIYDLYQDIRFQIQAELAGAATLVEAESGAAAARPESQVDVADDLAELFGDFASGQIAEEKKTSGTEAKKSGPRDEAEVFARRIEQFWLERLHEFCEDKARLAYFGISQSELGEFTHELHSGLARLDVPAELAEAMRVSSRYANMEKEKIVWRQSGLAAARFNSYVNWLGLDPQTSTESARTIAVGGKSARVFQPPAAFSGLPPLAEAPLPYGQNFSKDWVFALTCLIGENVSFDGNLKFNPAENSRLKNILEHLQL